MKIFFIRKNSLYKILVITLILILGFTIVSVFVDRKAKETFKDNEDVYYMGNVENNTIAFACNVDWGNELIEPMLDIFEKNNIKITFFVTGRWASNNKELLKNIYNQGHEIGNHGYVHRDYSKLGYDDNKLEILKTDKVIKETLDIKANLFAPPSGAYNDYTVKAARDLNYKVIMWSIDTIDWREDSTSEKIFNRVVSKSHSSAIVLMHPKAETVKSLPNIISTLMEDGYEIGRVSDIIK